MRDRAVEGVRYVEGVPGDPQVHGSAYVQLMWFSVSKLICHFELSGNVTEDSE